MIRRLVTVKSRFVDKHYRVRSRNWNGADLSIAVLSDIHVAAPWTSLGDLERMVAHINKRGADLAVLAGDFLAGRNFPGRRARARDFVDVLEDLKPVIASAAVLGNHDWEDCHEARSSRNSTASVARAFERSETTLLQNHSLKLSHEGEEFWLVGLDSQRSLHTDPLGKHDPDEAFAKVPSGANSILLAHEPDYFKVGDNRPALQISGHTHGGQVNLFGWRPVIPSETPGRKFRYGHYEEEGRHLVVSGGVGFSGVPLRVLQPPEITWIELSGAT